MRAIIGKARLIESPSARVSLVSCVTPGTHRRQVPSPDTDCHRCQRRLPPPPPLRWARKEASPDSGETRQNLSSRWAPDGLPDRSGPVTPPSWAARGAPRAACRILRGDLLFAQTGLFRARDAGCCRRKVEPRTRGEGGEGWGAG